MTEARRKSNNIVEGRTFLTWSTPRRATKDSAATTSSAAAGTENRVMGFLVHKTRDAMEIPDIAIETPWLELDCSRT
jgi:hypothetical protein